MDFQLTEEQQYFRRLVRDFAEAELKPRARHTDEAAEFNWPAVKKMGPIGLLGLNVPEDYGGAGIDAVSAAIAIEEIGRGCGSTGLAIAAHNGLGCAPIALFGSEELKKKFLPPLATGSGQLGALALTEPGAGSDLSGGVQTFAKSEGDEWVINGSKMWCTNASVADTIVTLCRTDRAGGSKALSLILVPTNTPGLIIGPAEKKMGLKDRHSNAVTYDNVRAVQYLVGKEGHGLHHTASARRRARGHRRARDRLAQAALKREYACKDAAPWRAHRAASGHSMDDRRRDHANRGGAFARLQSGVAQDQWQALHQRSRHGETVCE
jgi:alkylation response protein AidB-like acyl-CoA dehydrogenase